MAQDPHGFHPVVDADGGNVLLYEATLTVALDQGAFTHSGRACAWLDLEQIII